MDFTRKIGAGGFGETFLVKRNGILKSVKVFKDSASSEIKVLKKLMTRCISKHVLCFESFYKSNGKIYLSTEYVPGGDLFDYYNKLDNNKKINYTLEIINFKKFIRQLCEAVKYIHNVSVVHYDIKPENVMLDANKNVKLIDFGLAQISEGSKVKVPIGYSDGYRPSDMIIFLSPYTTEPRARWLDVYAVLRTFYNKIKISPYHILTKNMNDKMINSLSGILSILIVEFHEPNILNKLIKQTKN